MSDQTMFGDQTNSQETPANNGVQQNTNVQNVNPYADLLGSIRNETGAQKYNSVEDALKGASHAQTFIQQLQQEKLEMQRKLEELSGKQSKEAELERTVQELLSKVNDTSNQKQSITQEDIADLVNRTLTQRDTQKTAQENQTSVVNAATKAFGSKEEAGKKFVEAAQEAGLSVQEMEQLAAKSPKAVLKMMGVTEQATHKPQTFAPGSSVVNTAGFAPAQESFVGRNKIQVTVGATTGELREEQGRSRKMVDELHAAGLTVHDLTDPKVYKKYFR